jgi:integrase
MNSLRSQYTKRVYTIVFQKYIDFIGQNEDIFCQNNTRLIEHKIIDFIVSLRDKGLGHSAISNYVKAIMAFYKINDFVLNTDKISKFIPEYRKIKKDRAYTHQEIHRLLDFADERLRAVIYILASTGIRIGALPLLRLRNLQDNKLTVYENTNDEYITFCTPECSKAIDAYLNMRKRYGENITSDSFLIREQFDIRDPPKKSKPVKAETLARKLYDLSTRSGVRDKDLPVCNGFRKFFTTQLIEADVKTELRWLLEGHNLKANDPHYVRISEKTLQQEYEKAIDNLTIDPNQRLRKKIETLQIDKSQMESMKERMDKFQEEVELMKKRKRK